MIKAIVFDCFGVLTTDTWQAFIDSLPPEVDIKTVREIHRTYNMGAISRQECESRIQELTGKTFTEVEDLLAGEVTKNTALISYIRELKSIYKIAIMSNIASNWIRDSFLTEEEQSLFDAMIFSFEVGIIKPDPRIFMLTCERLRVGPHEAILVDDKAAYCQAAKAEGWKAVVYQDLAQLKNELGTILSLA